VFALDVIRIVGSSMSGGFVGIVDSTMSGSSKRRFLDF